VADIDRDYADSTGLVDARALTISPVLRDTLGLSDYILPGDTFASPIVISGTSGSNTFSLLGAKREAGEPDDTASAGNGTAGTVWFKYTPTVPGTLALSTSTTATNVDTVIEVYTGAALSDLTLDAFGDDIGGGNLRTNVSAVVGAGTPAYIRVHYKTSAITPISNNILSWTLTERTPVLTASIVSGDLAEAPGIVTVSVVQGTPGATLTLNLVGYGSNPLGTTTLDDNGAVTNWSVAFPNVAAGSKTLQFVTTAATTTATFNVLSQAAAPTNPGGNGAPVATATTRWVLEDLGPGGITYTLPNNPSRMTSPHPPRTITAEHTTSPDGQRLVWEGAPKPYPWEFEGYCGTQAFYDNLKLFVDIGRRFYLHDHRGRTWIVSFDYFDAQPRRDVNNYWAHDYTMRATIHGGPL
jgi:hypothetical protein